MISLVLAVIVGIVLTGIALSMRRFIAKRRREGAWGPGGPIHPTDRPLGAGDVYRVGAKAFEINVGPEGRIVRETAADADRRAQE